LSSALAATKSSFSHVHSSAGRGAHHTHIYRLNITGIGSFCACTLKIKGHKIAISEKSWMNSIAAPPKSALCKLTPPGVTWFHCLMHVQKAFVITFQTFPLRRTRRK
jgi:hypothetical protein